MYYICHEMEDGDGEDGMNNPTLLEPVAILYFASENCSDKFPKDDCKKQQTEKLYNVMLREPRELAQDIARLQ